MDKKAEVIQAFRGLMPTAPVQVWPAIVKAVDGTNCTVDIVGTDLVGISDVNLRADDSATEGVLLIPRVGSVVYVGAVENALDNLFVCLVSEVDRVELQIEDMALKVDKLHLEAVIKKMKITADKDLIYAVRDKCELTLSDVATLKQDQTEVTLSGNKVSVKNSGTNLKSLFTDLTTLLKTFTVVCAGPGAPSASVLPTTLTSITQLETKVNQLLA